MERSTGFPPDFYRHIRSLEPAYLEHDDPIRQSGFSGGAERWRSERGVILEAIDRSGSLIDAGCANGYLLECLATWASERGITIEPHGVDIGAKLIELAKQRLPQFAANFHVGNAAEWIPPQKYDYVYALHDCVPDEMLGEYAEHLLTHYVEQGGRLIVGAYGSQSRSIPARDFATALQESSYTVTGSASAGELPTVRIVWIDN